MQKTLAPAFAERTHLITATDHPIICFSDKAEDLDDVIVLILMIFLISQFKRVEGTLWRI